MKAREMKMTQTPDKSTAKKGRILVVSGPSGAGKGTVLAEFLKKHPGEYVYSVSKVTRAPREGEIDGVHYFFTTKEAFQNEIKENNFLEYAEYSGNFYGTPRDFVEKQLNDGKNVILEIEVQGALQVKAKRPDALFVFITPESYDTLENRLRGRGTETEDKILKRLCAAKHEAPFAFLYDYVIVNRDGEISKAADELDAIITASALRPDNSKAELETFFC